LAFLYYLSVLPGDYEFAVWKWENCIETEQIISKRLNCGSEEENQDYIFWDAASRLVIPILSLLGGLFLALIPKRFL
jgi:hypothetical protein